MIKRIVVFQTVVLLLFMGVTQAEVTTYATRRAFDLAHPGLPVEGFEAARREVRGIAGHKLVMGEGEVLDHLTDNAVFDPEDIMDGIQIFSSSGESQRLVVLGVGAFHYGFTIDSVKISNTNDASKLNLVFPGTVNAVAFEVQYGGDNVGIKAFDADGVLIDYEYEINTDFFGIYSTDPISRIEVNAPAGGDGHFEVIDNVAMGRDRKMLYFPIEKLTKRHFVFSAVTPVVDKKTIPVGNITYDQYMAEGGKLIGQVGRPGLPGFCRLIVMPKGAQVEVNITRGEAQTFHNAFIYPVQRKQYPLPPPNQQVPPSNDQQEIQQDDLFVIDEEFYQKDYTYPKRMYDISYDWVRGCRVAIINVHTSQYNPAQKKLSHYPNMQVDIRFNGGGVTYMPITQRSVFLEDMYSEVFSNFGVIGIETSNLISRIPLSTRCDLLIITPATFEAQANELAEWKTEKGFVTKVATLEDINRAQGGTSCEEIRAYIRNIYIRHNLSYVILLGDAETIPPHYETDDVHGRPIGTDLYYAEMDGEGFFPDLGIGRLSVDTEAEAQGVIDKIIAYEQSPPNDPEFYGRILHLAYFQDWADWSTPAGMVSYTGTADGRSEKNFVETMEKARDFFIREGYSALPRQYATTKDYWLPEHMGPQWYQDETPIPDELLYPGFEWEGDAEGISEELNKGCFLALYRGHGAKSGWVKPFFQSDDNFALLHNENLTPVTLSFTCNTGWFDNETSSADPGVMESFAERFLRMAGGTVAIVAASRETLYNDELMQGFIDCIWSDMLRDFPTVEDEYAVPFEGSARLGDALNYAKFYLASQILSETWGEADCLYSFEKHHLFGDPTMELWTESPYVELPPLIDFRVLQPFVPFRKAYRFPIEIDGVRASLIDHGKIVAQGISTKGGVRLKLNKRLSAGARLSLSKRGYLTQVYSLFSLK